MLSTCQKRFILTPFLLLHAINNRVSILATEVGNNGSKKTTIFLWRVRLFILFSKLYCRQVLLLRMHIRSSDRLHSQADVSSS